LKRNGLVSPAGGRRFSTSLVKPMTVATRLIREPGALLMVTWRSFGLVVKLSHHCHRVGQLFLQASHTGSKPLKPARRLLHGLRVCSSRSLIPLICPPNISCICSVNLASTSNSMVLMASDWVAPAAQRATEDTLSAGLQGFPRSPWPTPAIFGCCLGPRPDTMLGKSISVKTCEICDQGILNLESLRWRMSRMPLRSRLQTLFPHARMKNSRRCL